ncbi:hypothetical protein FAGAP_4695 [Fusarium agapanthi]|uniref:Uncharacterized protein n=1 Tax=Fusarium agapanthi TaxID=1803897 RepID=A0A9P5EFE9_9HYPO|nr:hypothetical protein FAGAP_4695 [Fusarium agapanthi]
MLCLKLEYSYSSTPIKRLSNLLSLNRGTYRVPIFKEEWFGSNAPLRDEGHVSAPLEFGNQGVRLLQLPPELPGSAMVVSTSPRVFSAGVTGVGVISGQYCLSLFNVINEHLSQTQNERQSKPDGFRGGESPSWGARLRIFFEPLLSSTVQELLGGSRANREDLTNQSNPLAATLQDFGLFVSRLMLPPVAVALLTLLRTGEPPKRTAIDGGTLRFVGEAEAKLLKR